jgi:hypothetical protein
LLLRNFAHPDQVLKIKYGQELNVERLEILSASGQLLKTLAGTGAPQQLDLSDLGQHSTHLYLRLITPDERVFTKKIILD